MRISLLALQNYVALVIFKEITQNLQIKDSLQKIINNFVVEIFYKKLFVLTNLHDFIVF
jgi:hypothetical protein